MKNYNAIYNKYIKSDSMTASSPTKRRVRRKKYRSNKRVDQASSYNQTLKIDSQSVRNFQSRGQQKWPGPSEPVKSPESSFLITPKPSPDKTWGIYPPTHRRNFSLRTSYKHPMSFTEAFWESKPRAQRSKPRKTPIKGRTRGRNTRNNNKTRTARKKGQRHSFKKQTQWFQQNFSKKRIVQRTRKKKHTQEELRHEAETRVSTLAGLSKPSINHTWFLEAREHGGKKRELVEKLFVKLRDQNVDQNTLTFLQTIFRGYEEEIWLVSLNIDNIKLRHKYLEKQVENTHRDAIAYKIMVKRLRKKHLSLSSLPVWK